MHRPAIEHVLTLVTQCPSEGFKSVSGDWVSLKCDLLDRGTAMKASIAGDFGSTVVVRVEVTIDGQVVTIDTKTARWISPTCANAMVPGDVAPGYPGVPRYNIRNAEEIARSLEAMSSYREKRADDLKKGPRATK